MRMPLILCVACFLLQADPAHGAQDRRVPVIYGTDLFHPHDDPDDHFDLATLFALPELDVRAIILDQGDKQVKRPGRIPLEQVLLLTGRRVPYATGLAEKLKAPDDTGRDQPAEFQGAIALTLKVLRASEVPVTIFTTGSVRDVCAAFNREPALLREKVARLYINIGNADDGGNEWNVQLDPKAYAGLLRSGLPIMWCPCLGKRYGTQWQFRQGEVLEGAPPGLQSLFIYALQAVSPEEIDPTGALGMDLRPWRRLVWRMDRNMWCTGPFLAAAGREVYRAGDGWAAAPPSPPGGQSAPVFRFVPARVEVDDAGRTKKHIGPDDANVRIFEVTDPERFGEAMQGCLRELFHGFPVAKER